MEPYASEDSVLNTYVPQPKFQNRKRYGTLRKQRKDGQMMTDEDLARFQNRKRYGTLRKFSPFKIRRVWTYDSVSKP